MMKSFDENAQKYGWFPHVKMLKWRYKFNSKQHFVIQSDRIFMWNNRTIPHNSSFCFFNKARYACLLLLFLRVSHRRAEGSFSAGACTVCPPGEISHSSPPFPPGVPPDDRFAGAWRATAFLHCTCWNTIQEKEESQVQTAQIPISM